MQNNEPFSCSNKRERESELCRINSDFTLLECHIVSLGQSIIELFGTDSDWDSFSQCLFYQER